jgi:hypothetical protein
MLLSEKRIKKKIISLESERDAWLKRAAEAEKFRSTKGKAKLYMRKAKGLKEKIDKLKEKLPEEKPAKPSKKLPEKDADIVKAIVNASNSPKELQENIDNMQSFTSKKLDSGDIVHLGLSAKRSARDKFKK